MLRVIKIEAEVILDEKQYAQLKETYEIAVGAGFAGDINEYSSYLAEYGLGKHILRNSTL